MNKFLEFIKEEKYIILTLLGLVAAGFFLWFGFTKTEQFGLNFLTEILGVVVTVFVIDRLIQNREDKRNIPQKLASYEDIRLYISRYIHFWTEAYNLSVPEESPETIQDFFSDKGIAKILNHLFLDSEPNVTPSMLWWDWFVINAKEYKENGTKILDRYSYNLDPIAFGYIHQLTESSFNSGLLMIQAIRQTDITFGTPRVKVLGNYVISPQDDYKAILGLVNWCNEKYIEFKKYNPSLKEVTKYIPVMNKQLPPKCMIPRDILEKQIYEVNTFRQSKRTVS